MSPDDLKRRTKQFALRILKLVAALPKSVEGRTIAGQLARAATAVGANYRAACRGRSKAEFVAKIGVVEEEADESGYWLELIIEAELLRPVQVEPLLAEANEIARIMARSRISASASLQRKANGQSAIGNWQSEIGNDLWLSITKVLS
jgi:four helix bundle protein